MDEEEAKALEAPSRSNTTTPVQDDEPLPKRRKFDTNSGLARFLTSDSTAETDDGVFSDTSVELPQPKTMTDTKKPEDRKPEGDTYTCDQCQKSISLSAREVHDDWHFAKSLQAQERSMTLPSNSRPPGAAPPAASKRGGSKSRGRGGKPEKGQSRLAFG